MYNKRSLLVAVITLSFVVVGFSIWKSNQRQEYANKVILAQNTRKVMNSLMFDLRGARQGSILEVPADGQWHNRIAFEGSGGPVEYLLKGNHLNRSSAGGVKPIADHIASLRMRRNSNDPAVVEVQIQARNKSSLVSNFKIRMQE